jgi:dCMP deaminase
MNKIHDTFMQIAVIMAEQATCSSKHKVGVVIAKDNRIIATGYNGAPTGVPHCDDVGCLPEGGNGRCIRAVHAEINAIIQCALYGVSTKGAILYTTLAPCRNCANAIIQAGIQEVRFQFTSSASAMDFLLAANIPMYDQDRHFYMQGGFNFSDKL